MKINAAMYADLVRLLIDGPCTYRDIVDETGLHIHTVRAYCQALHKRGVIHISDWLSVPTSRRRLAVWRFGHRKDAPHPPLKTRAEIVRDYRRRKANRLLDQALSSMVRV